MDNILQFLQATLAPMVLVYTVSNLAAMGLQVRVPQVVAALKNKRAIALIFVWGWVVGPALGYLITWILPLAEPYVIVVRLGSLAPCFPILQQMVARSRGDAGFAGALIPLVAIGTVVLMPLVAPLMITGVTINTWALAKPLLLTILVPLIIGAAIRHYADTAATRLFPVIKGLALITTLLTIIWLLIMFGKGILNTAGEFAFLATTLYMIGMGLIIYNFSYGMKQNQRSIMALGLGSMNGAALFSAMMAIPNADTRIWAMGVLWILWETPLAAIGAGIFGKLAGKSGEADAE